MRVVLKPGESVDVEFQDTDGIITVAFEETKLYVYATLPDSTNREGVVYEENFKMPTVKEVDVTLEWPVCTCGHIAQEHNRSRGRHMDRYNTYGCDSCNCNGYRFPSETSADVRRALIRQSRC